MRATLLSATLLAGLTGAAWAEAPFSFATTPGQLPKTVTPTAYTIDLQTDLTRLTLSGSETIAVTAAAPTQTVTLNQAGLTLTHASIDGTTATITQDQTAQTATLHLPTPLAAGPHHIAISYTGPILATPNGIYYDDYKTAAGPHRMLVTQFEVADARRMFPCWDEPAFKATFQLTTTLPANFTAVSNMPIAAHLPAPPGQQKLAFATTPRMSTYLLALFAGDLASVHGEGGSTPIATYAPRGEASEGQYAEDAATHILPYYNDYFGVTYPLPKLDLIAVPGNYEAGAMENWGAISFIDDALLFDPKTSTPSTKEEIYLVTAHEMAHQWSGDLVTMAWWDDIWLNEGFATWMENKATDHFNPEWQIWPRQHESREQAMAEDALASTHPIHQPIPDISAADSAFDSISYEKGSAVIRMIEDWLTPDTFRAGMRAYMHAHQYSNTTDADLWAALAAASGQNVAEVAQSFTDQPGIPQVNVSRTCQNGSATLALSQSRFALDASSQQNQTWFIPVTYGGPGLTPTRLVLGAKPQTLHIPGCNTAVKLNLGENGYYRTRYDAASLTDLANSFATLDPVDRTNLMGDQFALFEAGTASIADYLTLAGRLPATPSYEEVADTIGHFEHLDSLLRGNPIRTEFRRYAIRLLAPQLTRLGFTPRANEPALDALLRPLLISALGRFGDPETIEIARVKFQDFLRDPTTLAPELRGPVAEIAGRTEDAATYAALKNLVAKSTSTEDKLRYFQALASSNNPTFMAQSVAFAQSGVIPPGRIMYALAMVAIFSDNPDTAWTLIVPRADQITAKLSPGSQARLLPILLSNSTNTTLAQQMLQSPAATSTSGGKIFATRAAAAVQARAAERDRAIPALQSWFHAQG